MNTEYWILIICFYIVQLCIVVENQKYNLRVRHEVMNWKYFVLNLIPGGFIISAIVFFISNIKEIIIKSYNATKKHRDN